MAHPDNSFYGHNRVLSEYAGLGSNPPVIWGHLQHGWNARHGLSVKPRLVRWLQKLVWSEDNLKAACDAGISPVIAIGSPFCWLAASEARLIVEDPSRSTIVYPSHGWERDDVKGSHHQLISAIVEREQRPVTVCLYWREYDKSYIRRAYEEVGFRVICHGYRNDPHFIRRQFDELQSHDRVVVNRVQSALWYGALLGREVDVYGPVFSVIDADEAGAWDREQRARWPDLFYGGLCGEAARELAAAELGAGYVRPPDELRQLLGWTPEKLRRGRALRIAVRAEHHARRFVYTARLRLPRAEPLPRF